MQKRSLAELKCPAVTTIKLGDLREQVIELAQLKECTPHKLMVTAIRQYVETETKRYDRILKQILK